MLLPGLECDSSTSRGDNVQSYIQLVFQRLCKETGLQVLRLCEQFSLKHLHRTSEQWLMVFNQFAVAGSSLAGHNAGSLLDLLFHTKCDGCVREGVGWEVRCFDG